MFTMTETGSAIISECGRYRYRLDRRQDKPGPVVAFFGVNPSTADAFAEDATTRKWHGFCERNGFGKYIVGNIFSYRAKDVRELKVGMDLWGPDHHSNLSRIADEADILIPCWGDRGKLPNGLRVHLQILEDGIRTYQSKPVRIFGLTKGGDPKHPLMLSYDTPLIEWLT